MKKFSRKQVQEIEVIHRLPKWRRSAEGARLPQRIVGSTIVAFGTAPDDLDLEGGGLVIDYRPRGETHVRRAVLEFSEMGMWLKAQNSLSESH